MKLRGKFLWISLPALMLAAANALAGPPQAISECDSYIAEPGKYRLVNDLNCDPGVRPVKILASDVMFDLGGHSINCAAGDRSGVVVGDGAEPEVFSNVRISNGSVDGCAIGVLLWFTDNAQVTRMSFSNNTESGVTLVETQNNVIRNNDFHGGFWALDSYGGTDNRYSHNTIREALIGMDLYAETGSRINCNTVEEAYFTIGLGPYGQVPSSGNLIRGNLVTSSAWGITLVGYGTPADGVTNPQSIDNLVHANVALGNWWDLAEVLYDPDTEDLFPEPGGVCQNAWKNNQFEWQLGPPDCIGTPVDIEELCAVGGD